MTLRQAQGPEPSRGTKPPKRHESSRIMRARQRLAARAAESNWILQGIKMIQLRLRWSILLCLRVSLRHRDNSLFLKTLPDGFFKASSKIPLAHRLLLCP